MKYAILMLGAAATLAACASSPQMPRPRPVPGVMQSYQCSTGERVDVNFLIPQGIAQLRRGGVTTDLHRTSHTPPTYRGGPTTMVTDADRGNITLTVGRMAPMNCSNVLRPTNPIVPRPQPPAGPSEIRTNFACNNGERIVLRRIPHQGTAVLERGGQSVELNRQRTHKGFLYSNGQTEVRGNGHTITMTVGRMTPARCRAF